MIYDSNRAAAIEFVRGAGFVLLVMGIFFGFILTLGGPEHEAATKFEVVDKYDGCDVVRYTDRSNNWHYFLKCDDTDRN